MSLYKQYKTDSSKENDGIEVEFHDAENDDETIPTFMIARMGPSNKAYQRELESATRPYRRQIELGSFTNKKAEPIFIKVFVKTILKGWRNVQDEHGNLIEFNEQNAIKLLTDLPDLYKLLSEQAADLSNFRIAGLEQDAKN